MRDYDDYDDFNEIKRERYSNAGYHLTTLQFNLTDTAQYWLSLDHVLEHMGWSDHPVSALLTTMDKVCFGAMVVGSTCTLISNQYAYFLLNRAAGGEQPLNINFSPWQRRILGGIVFLSVLNKSLAVASSFYALEHDYDRPQAGMYINFILALLSHYLAQAAVQGISGNWHAGCKKMLAAGIAAISAGYYTVSLLALNWNSLDNACMTFGWLAQRPHIDSHDGFIKLAIVIPFFTASLLRTPVVYFHRKINRLLSEQEAQERESDTEEEQRSGRDSCCAKFQKVIGGLSSVQRSGNMLLSLAAILYGFSNKKAVSWTLAVISSAATVWGTLKSNAAVMYPKTNHRARFLNLQAGNLYTQTGYSSWYTF